MSSMKIFLDASFLVYLLIKTPEIADELVRLYAELTEDHELYTDILVLDETVYVSKKKYRIPYESSIKFIDDYILPYVEVLPIGLMEYLKARENILKYKLRPSDAIHLAVIENNGLQAIVTEDEDFENIPVKIIWFKGD